MSQWVKMQILTKLRFSNKSWNCQNIKWYFFKSFHITSELFLFKKSFCLKYTVHRALVYTCWSSGITFLGNVHTCNLHLLGHVLKSCSSDFFPLIMGQLVSAKKKWEKTNQPASYLAFTQLAVSFFNHYVRPIHFLSLHTYHSTLIKVQR